MFECLVDLRLECCVFVVLGGYNIRFKCLGCGFWVWGCLGKFR